MPQSQLTDLVHFHKVLVRLRVNTSVWCNGCRRSNRCCTPDRDTPAFLPSPSAMVFSCMTGSFAVRIEVLRPASEAFEGKTGHPPVASRATSVLQRRRQINLAASLRQGPDERAQPAVSPRRPRWRGPSGCLGARPASRAGLGKSSRRSLPGLAAGHRRAPSDRCFW
jgi:hypothetical protein